MAAKGHGWRIKCMRNKMHGLSWRRRICHISLNLHKVEQVWWSHAFWAPFWFNLRDFHFSTEVINHVATRAAWRQDAETAAYTNILNRMQTLKGTTAHFSTTGALYIHPFSIHVLQRAFFFLMHTSARQPSIISQAKWLQTKEALKPIQSLSGLNNQNNLLGNKKPSRSK